jgi:hypothetical protein
MSIPTTWKDEANIQWFSERVSIVDQSALKNFEDAAADFARFAVSQGFPPNLLWVKADNVLLGRWKGRWIYFIWKDDPAKRQQVAKAEYESAISRNIGVAFEGKFKTDRWTICRVYVPVNDLDAQYRMIPQTGLKLNVAVEPLPAMLLRNRMLWQLLKWMLKTKEPAWD